MYYITCVSSTQNQPNSWYNNDDGSKCTMLNVYTSVQSSERSVIPHKKERERKKKNRGQFFGTFSRTCVVVLVLTLLFLLFLLCVVEFTKTMHASLVELKWVDSPDYTHFQYTTFTSIKLYRQSSCLLF